MTGEEKKPLVWDIESTNPDLVPSLKEALNTVLDPELGLSIIQLGLIRNVAATRDDGFHLTMILTTPFCPYGPQIIEMARQKAEDALARPVTIEFSPEMWDYSMLEDGAAPEWGMYM